MCYRGLPIVISWSIVTSSNQPDGSTDQPDELCIAYLQTFQSIFRAIAEIHADWHTISRSKNIIGLQIY